jgi:multidrug resistance efflux pump
MRRVVVSLVLIALLFAAGTGIMRTLAARRKKPERETATAPAVAVRVMAAKRTSFREELIGYGRARALRTTRAAAEVAGVVRWLAPELEAGATVAKDQELVRIDDRDLVQAVALVEARQEKNRADAKRLAAEGASARAKLAVARDELATAERELARIESLRREGAGTESDLDRERLAVALRRTAVIEIEGRLATLDADVARNAAEARELAATEEQARLDLSRATIRAPYAGRIVARSVEPGARVAPGAVLFEIVDPARVEIPVALPAARYGQVADGAAATLRLGAREVPARVARIAPEVRPDDRTFFVYVVVEAADGAASVPPGAFVTAAIEGRRYDDVFVLPRTAFVGERIFVAHDGVARERTPAVREALPHLLLVEGGVEEGESIIVTNLDEVADGTRVAPTP